MVNDVMILSRTVDGNEIHRSLIFVPASAGNDKI